VVVIPIADRHVAAGEELAGVLRGRGLRVEVDGSDSRMQNKIRLAQGQKVPYMVVLGDREVEARQGTVRRRGAAKEDPQETLGWDEIADRLAEESRERRVS
jgi:threonyl-tRNA synthetase